MLKRESSGAGIRVVIAAGVERVSRWRPSCARDGKALPRGAEALLDGGGASMVSLLQQVAGGQLRRRREPEAADKAVRNRYGWLWQRPAAAVGQTGGSIA